MSRMEVFMLTFSCLFTGVFMEVFSDTRSCSMRRLEMIGGYVNEDRALNGSVLSEVRVKSVRDCTVRCLSTPGCLSFNYEAAAAPLEHGQGFRTCELNDKTVWAAGLYRLVPRQNFVYYEKVDSDGAMFVKPVCGAVPNVTNASPNVTDSTYVTSVAYTCQNGYDVYGSYVIHCQPDGTWETPPTCLVSLSESRCGIYPVVDRATASRDAQTDTVTYECEPGYILNGSNPVGCSAGDVWEPVPQCIERSFPTEIALTNKEVAHPSLGNDGSWMSDTAIDNGMVYVTEKSHDMGNVIEYTSANFPYTNLPNKINVDCDGTGHVIHNGYLYCGQHNALKIMKYRLADGQALATGDLPTDAGVHDVYPYTCTRNSDIDIAADENGLWVVYANTSNNMVVSRLDVDTLALSETRVISDHAKTNTAETFIIDGILYAINSSPSEYVSYVYDIFRGIGKSLGPADLPVAYAKSDFDSASGSAQNVDSTWTTFTMVDYNPREKMLYVYSQGEATRYSITVTF